MGDGEGIGITAFFPVQDTHPVGGGRGMREWPGSAGDQDVSYAPASLDSEKRSWAAVSRSMTYIGPWQRGHCQVARLFEDDASGAGFGWLKKITAEWKQMAACAVGQPAEVANAWEASG